METDGRALDAKGETMSVAAGKQRAKEEDGVGQGRGAASEQVRGGAQEEAEELDSEGVEDSEDEDEWEPYIDSYLLHSPLHTIPDTLEAWRAMEALVDEGKVRRIGLSSESSRRVIR